MNKNKIFAVILILGCILACTKVTTLDDLAARAVVEGYLQSGEPINIKITKEIKFGGTDTVAIPINGLSVIVKDNTDNKSYTLTNVDSGFYKSQVLIQSGHSYDLGFTYNGQSVTASTTVPSRPKGFALGSAEVTITPVVLGGGFGGGRPNFGDPIALSWINNDQTFYLTAYKNLEASQESIITGNTNFGFRRRPTFNEPTQGSTAQIRPIQLEFFGHFDIYCMHVQPEYAALYSQTSNTSISIAPPPTNITNGLGIFTGFAADTLKFFVRKG